MTKYEMYVLINRMLEELEEREMVRDKLREMFSVYQ